MKPEILHQFTVNVPDGREIQECRLVQYEGSCLPEIEFRFPEDAGTDEEWIGIADTPHEVCMEMKRLVATISRAVDQNKIGKWHRETFGDENIIERILKKFKEESSEFIEDPTPEEAADVALVLLAYADRQGFSLSNEVLKKFKKVQSRDQVARDAERGIT